MRHIKRSQLRGRGVVVDRLLASHRINRNLDSRVLMISPIKRYSMIGKDWRRDKLRWWVNTHRGIEFEFFEVDEIAGEDCGFEFCHEWGVRSRIMEVAETTITMCLIHGADWLDFIGVFAISQASLQVGWVIKARVGHETLCLALVIVRSGTLDFGVEVFIG